MRSILVDDKSKANTITLNIVLPSTLLNKAINSVHFRHPTGFKHTLFSFKLFITLTNDPWFWTRVTNVTCVKY